MRTYLDCYSCFIAQALRSARVATDNEDVQKRVLSLAMKTLSNAPLSLNPPEIARKVYHTIGQVTGNTDPYKKARKVQNRIVLEIYPKFKQAAYKSKNPLYVAMKLAIVGNVIDLGTQSKMDNIKKEIDRLMLLPLHINHFRQFMYAFMHSNTVLYLADNAGEIVFDKFLIEELKSLKSVKIFFVVRGGPIINDATLDDAKFIGMETVAEVLSNGFDAPGTLLHKCSSQFKELFWKADLVISKGQGNFETLSGLNSRDIFFLLRAKCSVAARDLGVNVGDLILKQDSPIHERA